MPWKGLPLAFQSLAVVLSKNGLGSFVFFWKRWFSHDISVVLSKNGLGSFVFFWRRWFSHNIDYGQMFNFFCEIDGVKVVQVNWDFWEVLYVCQEPRFFRAL